MTGCKPLSHAALPDAAAADNVAAVLKQGPVTHAEFVSRVQGWYTRFLDHPGPSVALYFEDAFDFATALFGAWHAGKQVMLPADKQPSTLEQVLPLVDLCAGSLPHALTLDDIDINRARPADLAPFDLMQARVTIFTSGSTGVPQHIHKRVQQLDAEVQALQAAFGHELDHPGAAQVYSSVSHQHIYGLLFHVLWPLTAGRPIMVERLVYPEQVVAHLAHAETAVLISSPALLSRLPDHLDWAAVRPAIRAVFSGGGALTPAASQHCFERLGRSPTEVLGSSETGGIAWRRAAASAAWQSFSCVQWRITEGLLEVRSPYLDEPDQWYATSDRVALETDTPAAETAEIKRFVLLGRSDRIVKIAEKRVSLTAIETALQALPEVAAARTLALPTGADNAALRVAAVVELSDRGWARLFQDGRLALNAYFRGVLRAHVEAVALPRRWRYVEAFPVNEQGKVTQRDLQSLFRPWLPECIWLHRDAFDAQAQLTVPPDSLVFDGHFPQASLVPGVAQVHWVHLMARDCFPLPEHFLRLEALKFQQPIVPGQKAGLTLKWNPEKHTLSFRYESAGGAHSSGRLVYAVKT